MRDRSAIGPPKAPTCWLGRTSLRNGKRESVEIAGWMKWTRRCEDRRRCVADVRMCCDDGSTKGCEDVRRVGWPARGPGENRVTVARTAGDQPLNTRRSNCHARFMGRQRNHTSTRNLPSLIAPLPPPPSSPLSSAAPWARVAEMRRTFSFDTHGIKSSW